MVTVIEELTEARRRAIEWLIEEGVLCKMCGGPINGKTPGCKNCYNRHRGRELRRKKKSA